MPYEWENEEKKIISTREDHDHNTTWITHTHNDEINNGLSQEHPDQTIIEYVIRSKGVTVSKKLYKNKNITNLKERKDGSLNDRHAWNALRGDIGEHIARMNLMYYLRHHYPNGRIDSMFDSEFKRDNSQGYVVGHHGKHILKIKNYPNMEILEHRGDAPADYKCIKEIDGLFLFNHQFGQYLIVMESKTGSLTKTDEESLVSNLFNPLRKMFPDRKPAYLLFGTKEQIYTNDEFRVLKHKPVSIYKMLQQHSIDTMFMTFNETSDEFDKMADQVVKQYKWLNDLELHAKGWRKKEDCLELYNGGQRPVYTLRRDPQNPKIWHELPVKSHEQHL